MVLTKYLNKITYSEFKVVLLLGLKTAGIADELVVYPNHSLTVSGLVKHQGSEAAYLRMVGNHADFWSICVLARMRFNRKLAALSFMSFGCRMVFRFVGLAYSC